MQKAFCISEIMLSCTKQPEYALHPKKNLSLKTAFFVFFFLSSSIDLFAGSKKVFIEETRAAQEERLNFAAVTGASQTTATSPVMNEEQWLMTVYLKGKEYYDQGDYQAAVTEWKKINTVVERYPAFKMVIDYLTGREKALSPDAVQQVDKRLEDRRRQIEQAFQRGKQFYDKNDMDKALVEWDRLALYLPEEAPQRRLISDLKSYYSQSQMTAPKEVDPMTKELSGEMLRFFASAAELYKTQAIQAKGALQASENAQETVGSGFQKAKLLYYEGNYDKAIEELEKIKPFFRANSSERESLEDLIQIYHQAEGEKQAANSAMQSKNIKVKTPAEFSKFVEEVHEKFKVDLKESETQRRAREKAFEDQQSWMSADFKKGLDLYKAGNTEQAIAEWEKVAPNFENEETVRQLIDKVKKHTAELQKIRFEQEKSIKEKQALINGTLENGRLLYQAGKYDQAAQEWNNISSLFEDPTQFQEFIKAMGEIHKNTAQIEKAKIEAQAKAGVKFRAPDSLIQILSEAKERLKKETDAAEAEKQRAQKAGQTQEFIQRTIESGRLLAQAGKIDEAVKEWNKVSNYFEDADKFKEFIKFMEAIQVDLSAAQSAKNEAATIAGSKIQTPATLSSILSDAKARLKKESDAADLEKQKAQKNQQTQDYVNKTIQSGRELAQAGKMSEAVAEWSKLTESFEDAGRFEEFIRSMSDIQKEWSQIQVAKQEASAIASNKIQTPAVLSTILSEAKVRLKQEMDSAEQEGQKAKKAQQVQSMIETAMESGRVFAKAGQYNEAIKEWSKISGLFEDKANFENFLGDIATVQAGIEQAKKSQAEAQAKSNTKFKTPADLDQILSETRNDLKEKMETARQTQTKSEQSLADRQTLVRQTITNGKMLLESGKWEEAVKVWREVLPYLEDSEKLEQSISELEAMQQSKQKAEISAREAELKKDSKVSTPDGLSDLIKQATREIEVQVETARSRKRKADLSLADKQTLTSEGYDKGKALLADGQYIQAFQEWQKILSNFDDVVTVKPMLDKATEQTQALVNAKKLADQAESKKDLKVKTPSDFSKLLESALAKINTETEMAKTKRGAAEESYASRESLVQSTFEKGKALYNEGQYAEALDIWKKMLSELSDGEQIKRSIDQIEASYGKLIDARKDSEEAEKKQKAGVTAPSAFKAMLDEIGQKLSVQTEASAKRKAEAEKSISEKTAKAEAIFAKGKLLYDEGKASEAFYEWQNMIPYLQDGSSIKENLNALQANHEELRKIEMAAKEAEIKKDSKLPTPSEFAKVFDDISLKLKSQIQSAQDTQKKHESVLADRKSMVLNSFEKGKELYADGRFEEAFDTWGLMLPALEDEGLTRKQIEGAKEAYQNLALAEKAARVAEEKKDQKLKAPEGFAALISESTDKLKIRSIDAQSQKALADQAYKIRQSELMAKVAEGNKLFEDGRFEEAHAIWLSVMPSIENTADFQAAIDELRKIHDERKKVEALSEQAAALKDTKFPAPAGITAEIVDARAKLKAQLAEAEAYKAKAEQQLAGRQAQIQAAFEKGKQAYWDGKVSEAVQEWSSIADSLEDQSVRKSIQTVAESYDNLLKTQRAAQEAELKKNNKLRTPDELPRLLADAKQIVSSQQTYSETQKKIADQTFVDRQALINTTYEKGKRLYNENRIPEALEEWGTITPYLENGSQLKEFIQGVQESYDQSLIAKKAADEAQVKRTIKFQSPENLSTLLEETGRKLKAQADESQSKKAEADKTRADRQLFIDSNFLRGKLLYEEGKLTEAIDIWKSLLPYLHDDGKVRQLIVKAENARRELSEQQKKSKLEEDVRNVIQDKKISSTKIAGLSTPAKPTKAGKPAKSGPQLDEIEQMMLEYNIASKTELEKRHQELQAVK